VPRNFAARRRPSDRNQPIPGSACARKGLRRFKVGSCSVESALAHVERDGQLLREACVHEIEAAAELDQGTYDGRRHDPASALLILGELERAVGAILPEVDAFAEPVVVVLALLERIAAQQALCRLGIASVVGEARGLARRGSLCDGAARGAVGGSCRALIGAAYAAGPRDNISAVVVRMW